MTKAPAGNRSESLESALLHARARACERIQYVEARQPSTYVCSVVAGMVWHGLAKPVPEQCQGDEARRPAATQDQTFFFRGLVITLTVAAALKGLAAAEA